MNSKKAMCAHRNLFEIFVTKKLLKVTNEHNNVASREAMRVKSIQNLTAIHKEKLP